MFSETSKIFIMINLKSIIVIASIFIKVISLHAQSVNDNDPNLVAHFPMEVTGNSIAETKTGKTFVVENNFYHPESTLGAEGNAL